MIIIVLILSQLKSRYSKAWKEKNESLEVTAAINHLYTFEFHAMITLLARSQGMAIMKPAINGWILLYTKIMKYLSAEKQQFRRGITFFLINVHNVCNFLLAQDITL